MIKKIFLRTLLTIIFLCGIITTKAQVITTLAGTGTASYTGDGVSALNATLNAPFDMAIDNNNNIYIADSYNGVIRKITPSGIITTVAGTGINGYNGDGGLATAARLNYPSGVAVDAAGNLYISDYSNSRIRMVNASTGNISTICGTGTNGFTGDGAAATAARVSAPFGIAIDVSGNIYFIDAGNYRIRKFTVGGNISTICGNGTSGFGGDGGLATSATLSASIHGIALDASNNIYFTDNYRIRKINASDNFVNTIIGNGTNGNSGDGAAAIAAQINGSRDIAIATNGDIYFTDFGNNQIRKVNTSNIISTVAGNATSGFSGDGGAPTLAQLSFPYGIAFSNSLNKIYIADQGNNKVRVVSPQNGLHFTGTDAQIVDDQIVVPHNAAFNVNAFTFEAWVKEDNNTSNVIFSKGGSNGVQNDGSYIFYLYQNKLGFYTRNQLHFYDTAVLCPNVWSHVAATYDGVSTLRFYVNGTPTKVFTNLTGPLQSPGAGPLGIGVQGPLGSPLDPCNCNRFNGAMDELRMWNYARSAAQINASLNKELLGNESGLILYYPFNMGIANSNNTPLTTAYDATGNGNSGTMQGFNLNGTTSNYIAPNNVTTLGCTAEIEVKGNNIDICSGDATPSTTDFTDWGNVALGSKQTKEFYIKNLGTTALTITAFNFTGVNASEFSTIGLPALPITINAGNRQQLLIDCAPSATGTRTATLNIFSNDCDESTFSYALQATSCTPTLANSGDTKTSGFWGNNNFLTPSTCRVIADLSSYTFQGNSVMAKVTVDATVQTTGTQPYVQRHYDIEPSVSASDRTATVTLYYSQAEFNAFNAHPNSTLDLPTGVGDAAGISNLRITQYHGTGTNPNNYTGSKELINPMDANIVWEAAYSRWKVTFNVTGFSGFYVHTGNAILGTASALNFDGANDYVVIPRLDFSAGNVMTIEAWIKPNNITTNQFYEISRQQIVAVNPPDLLLSFQNNGTILSFGTRTTTGYNELDIPISAANYVDGNWHHIAAVYDGATKKIYRDGVLLGQNNFTGNLIYSPTAVNLIGNSAEAYNEPFNGSMDEVRLWNRALPQCEILNNMNCELAAGQNNLMAYYQFNQGLDGQNNAGITSLTDASGNSRTGTLTNFVLTGTTSNWVNPGGVVTGTTCGVFVPLSATNSQVNVTCFAGNNGSATVAPIGGFGGYTYSWSPSGGTAATATGLTAGSYTCTITSGGCVITRNFIITEPAATLAPTGLTTQIYAGNTANLTALTLTGTAIQWYAGAIGGSALPNTTLLVDGTIYHANQTVAGCISSARLAVTVRQISAANQSICNAGTIGNLVSTASAGTTANWFAASSGGSALANNTVLSAGNYYVEQSAPLSTIDLATGFSSPTGVAIQSDGKIVVADFGTGTIKRINADGTGLVTVASGFGFIYGVAVQSDSKIIVADYGNSSIKRVNADGTSIVTLGSGFSAPSGVAVQSDGKIIVADFGNGVVKRMNADGSGIVILGSGFMSPWSVAIQTDGKIIVSDIAANNVKRMNSDGTGIVTLATGFNSPFGVAVQSNGKIIVADHGNAQIKRMNADGSGIVILNSTVSSFGVAVQSDDKILVSANSNNTIKRITDATTSNRVAVSIAINAATLANHLDNVTQNIVGTGSTIAVINSSCRIIASIVPNGVSPIAGNTTSKVWIETTQPAQFVKRHYEITPTTGASTATGRVTLYFTQAEFNDFNAVNATSLPTGIGDAIGIANLLIEKRGGVSSDGTGLPTTYSGAITTINPADADIVWNTTLSRWEISVDVTGFSGFFVKTQTAVLPIKLISFTGENQSNKALLTWEIAEAENNINYVLQRSQTATQFYDINTQIGTSAKTIFNYTDLDFNNNAYYRLKIIEVDGRIMYSNIIRLNIKPTNEITIYPNPVQHAATLEVNDKKLIGTVANLLSVNGAVLQKIIIKNRFEIIDLSLLPAGIYLLQTSNGAVQKIVKN